MNAGSRLLAVALAVLAFAAAPAATPPAGSRAWTQFRGPNATGIAAAPAPPAEFGRDKNLLWKTSLAAGHSSPVIWGNRLFLTAFDAPRRKLEVLGLDRRTGAILWRRDVEAPEIEPVHAVSNPATGTAAVDGERVYAYFGSYGLLAFDLDGKPQWSVPMPVVQAPFGSGTSPVVAGELVLLNRLEPKDPCLIAVDRKTGRMVWKTAHSAPARMGPPFLSYATPVIAGREAVLHEPRQIAGYDLATGERRWWVPVATGAASTPAVSGDTVYVATWNNFGEAELIVPLPEFAALVARSDKDADGQVTLEEFPEDLAIAVRPDVGQIPGATFPAKMAFRRIDKDKDGKLQESEWQAGVIELGRMQVEHGLVAVRAGGVGDVTATHVRWREKTSVEVPSPLAYEGRVYMVRNGGIVTCLDSATGKIHYRARIGAGGPYYASPVVVDGRIFIASGDGTVVVLKAGDILDVVARNDLAAPIFATPAIADGTLYVRTATDLLAFKKK